MPFRSQFTSLFNQDTTIAWVVFGLICLTVLVAITLSWWRHRRGRGPSEKAEANRLELSYVAALVGIVVFLVISSFAANGKESADPPATYRVQVTAFQWCWHFSYLAEPVTISGQCGGRQLPVLVLPAGQPVELQVTSSDVVHAFWVPYLNYKTYAYPGHVNKFTVTMPDTGKWIGRCAQLCGVYHYQMAFWVEAVPPAQFKQFLDSGGHSIRTQLTGAGVAS
jgi:cytochrome c oxidase subunit 2